MGPPVRVELIYAAGPDAVWRQTLDVPEGTTVARLIALSGFPGAFPALAVDRLAVGIYGQVCSAGRIVADGDRVEIYRRLRFDPMESRRRRAAHKRKTPLREATGEKQS